MHLSVGSGSDVGQLRSLNEDSLLVTGDLFAVADGMGGHRGGEVASALALERFAASVAERTLDSLMAAVQAANRGVLDHARSAPELTGMGTTLCALSALDDHRVAVVNVGDSRVYLLRNGALFQVSEDHSFVESLVREGRLTRAQADVHPQRNVITRALGIEPHIDVDGWEIVVTDGDRFVLCSDGLFNEVPDGDIEAVLLTVPDPVEAAGRLIDAANAGGGRDNITCVIVDIADVGPGGAELTAVGRPIDDSVTRRSTAADLDETSIDEPTLPAGQAAAAAGAPTATGGAPKRRRSPTWRTVVFLLSIVTIFVVAGIATEWFYKNTYSVGERAGQVVIFSGPETKWLWYEADVTSTGVDVDDLRPAEQDQVTEGIPADSLAAAQRTVKNLVAQAEANATTTTTTTTAPTTTTSGVTTTTELVGP